VTSPAGIVQSRRAAARGDQRGGAVSLWVVLMVPVSAFAAVVAMAGPQRMAAESSVQEAADDLAMFTVAWRDGARYPDGPLRAFPPECAARTPDQQAEMNSLRGAIAALDPNDPNFATDLSMLNEQMRDLSGILPQPPPWNDAADQSGLNDGLDAFESQLDEWDTMCEHLFEALVRDLGNLGVDMGSLRGSYSDSLEGEGYCSDPAHSSESVCTDAGETWFELPCLVAVGRSDPIEHVVVSDAAHVALAADWQDAGWAAAQVWPDGLPMAAESIGRLSQHDSAANPLNLPRCDPMLVVLDSQGRPVWSDNPKAPSRRMAQSAPRSVLAG
jgi:hypothetical protein